MKTTIVLGAGIGGLAAAEAIAHRGGDVVLLEAADRPGGLIRSTWIDGVLVEGAAQTLRGVGALWPLVQRLGLSERVLPAAATAKNRYLLHQGRLVALPGGPVDLLRTPLLTPMGRWRVLAEPFLPGRLREGETVYDLLARRIGAEAADVFGTPFVGGIFGGDPRLVEAESALPRVAGWAKSGSLVRGAAAASSPAGAPRVPFSFPHGIEELPRALARALGDRLRLRTAVRAIERSGSGWRVRTDGDTFEGSSLVVALPAHVAAGLLTVPVPDHAPVAAVMLAFDGVPSPDGFGWLAHPRETTEALGAIHVSSLFPAHAPGKTAIRVMLGGTRAPALAALSDDSLVAHARRVLAAVLQIHVEPALTHVARALPGIPQYPPGFAKRVRETPDVTLIGWGWTGPGIPDAIEAAERLADRL